MKKVIIAVGIVVIFAAFVFYQHENDAKSHSQVSGYNPAAGDPIITAPSPQTPASPVTTSASPAVSGQYKDGSYTGSVADAIYGKLQVVAVIQNGKIIDVQFPVYPNTPGHTTDVSNQALPQLKSEAIAAQNAQVDVISGATQDSQAFVQSLQSALDQARM